MTAISATDKNATLSALLAFKEAINEDPKGILTSWNPTLYPDHCTWPGVLCELDHFHVTSLHLASLQLNGTITPRLADLMPQLVYFNISNNSFHGSIPEQIANVNSSSLQIFDLSFNSLSGSIPTSISRYGTCLRYLDLNNNQLSMDFTEFISNTSLINLEYLDLSYNNGIVGPLPAQVGLLSNLRVLHLRQCSIRGIIPAAIANCSSLQSIDLINSSLRGPIPSSLGTLTFLSELKLSLNSLSGSIPTSISNCTELTLLWLTSNVLSGVIPPDIGNLHRLQQLRLAGNKHMTGSIPSSIGECSEITMIAFEYNSGKGSLPDSVYNLTNLQVLGLTSCGLTGSLSERIRNLKYLQDLRVSYNNLQGLIPAGIGQLKQLQGLDVEGNNLTGPIPPELSGCTNLSNMALSLNSLSGSIPSSFAELWSIRNLSLQSNFLSGEIPDIFENLNALTIVDLSLNLLSGHIPQSLANLQTLSISLDLSFNNLTGSIPPSFGKMYTVNLMNLSNNQFTGQIPAALGYCQGMEILDLSSNNLNGEIPNELGEMISLQFLDLSKNYLTGYLPTSLGNLSHLSLLNVSYNDLQGRIPRNGIYQRLGHSSFIGNPGLCGFPLSKICAYAYNRTSQKETEIIVIVVALCALATIILAFVVCAWCFWCEKNTSVSDDFPLIGLSNNHVPKFKSWRLNELKAMTNNFDTRNVIGTGSVSVCYKGFVQDSEHPLTVVAIKRMSIWDHHVSMEARKSFANELKTICNMKHRNLVKTLGYCIEGLEVALVMEYMDEGDLNEHLYGDMQKRLSWEERLNVAMDVAEGLVYMHHEYGHTIVHCDLKPKNILLGSNKIAKISDFGISRLLGRAECGVDKTTSMFRGTLGYAAPEYAAGLRISTQVDVYSYGVLLIELLSGVSPTSSKIQDMGTSLQDWAAGLQLRGRTLEVLDVSIQESAEENKYILEDANRILAIAIDCCSHYRKSRPTMKFIRNSLSTLLNGR